jgi:predicted alpha/beta-fold hydrolase
VLPHVAGYDEVANMHGIEGAEKECYLHRLVHRFYHNLFSLAEAEAKVVACHQY